MLSYKILWSINQPTYLSKTALKPISTLYTSAYFDASLDFVPDSDIVYSGAHEIEIMEAQRLREGHFVG